jgi:hypothetical protein
MTDDDIDRAICMCMAVERAEIAVFHASLMAPESDRLHGVLLLLRAEWSERYQAALRMKEDLEIEHFEESGEAP